MRRERGVLDRRQIPCPDVCIFITTTTTTTTITAITDTTTIYYLLVPPDLKMSRLENNSNRAFYQKSRRREMDL